MIPSFFILFFILQMIPYEYPSMSVSRDTAQEDPFLTRRSIWIESVMGGMKIMTTRRIRATASCSTGAGAAAAAKYQAKRRATAGKCNATVTEEFTTAKSQAVFTAAQEIMPGGVSSPVRAFKSVGGGPIVFDRVKGSKAYDVDGNEYIDYIGTWGPAICGHANDEVGEALKAQIDKGTSFGAPCELEVRYTHTHTHTHTHTRACITNN